MTGIASGKVLELDMKRAAKCVKELNAQVAKEIGIGPASRCTTVKPAGTTSLRSLGAWATQRLTARGKISESISESESDGDESDDEDDLKC